MKKIVVVGGGPAGMMAAIAAAEAGGEAVLLEKNEVLGRKLALTGKGRCNLANASDIPEVIKNIPGNGVFLRCSEGGRVCRPCPFLPCGVCRS